ncbi:MAG: glycosyltransferase family 4 protein [Patescibacteria group bacterium]|nr:glycosyltransferase family 4 protein [Patescibacteria group bacterium]
MKIAIDCSKAVNESAGIARYTWELADNLAENFPQDQFFYFFNFLSGKSEKLAKIKKLIRARKNISYKIYPLPGQLKEKLFPGPISLGNIWLKGNDIYHATEFLSFDRNLTIPQILTVHDLTMIKFPAHRGEAISSRHGRMLARACQNASGIIAVSQSTKKDIIKYFKIPEKKVEVIYQGVDPKFQRISNRMKINSVLKKYQIDSPFILFVGTIEPRKNIVNLLLAFEKFKTNFISNFKLVLIGRQGWNAEEIKKTHQNLACKDDVIFLDYLPDDHLNYFYNAAKVLCYPSLYEGFGFPVVEAMACKTPVITSRNSSLVEAGGQAAYYIDPKDVNSIATALKKVLTNDYLAKKMVELGLKQAKKFSWRVCAQQTHQYYQKVLDEQNK